MIKNKENNNVYTSQLVAMALILATTFKVVMLPKYIAKDAGRSAFIVMAIMMAIEFVMYFIVYYSITRINLLQEKNKWLMIPVMISIYMLCMFKGVVFFGEAISYVASTLFDIGRVAFIILAFLPILAYLVHKGGNTIGRLTQVIVWIIIAAAVISLLFIRIKGNVGSLFPLFDKGVGQTLSACEKYIVWFGDYIPLFTLCVHKIEHGRSRKAWLPITLAVAYIAVVGFFIVFTIIYGNSAEYIDFAFSKVAVFSRISELLGSTDFLAVITWLMMAIIKLSIVLYAGTMALTYFIKSKAVALFINMSFIGIMCGFVVVTVEQAHAMATSWVRYPIMIIQYILPIVIAIYVRVKYAKTNQA